MFDSGQHASRFPIVEADMGFYAIPDRLITERWAERTPDDFVFNLKAHALMTGHATDIARLPKHLRDARLTPEKRYHQSDAAVENDGGHENK